MRNAGELFDLRRWFRINYYEGTKLLCGFFYGWVELDAASSGFDGGPGECLDRDLEMIAEAGESEDFLIE